MRDTVMVVGSGMMGSGIGAMSALAGNKTVLVDVDEKRVQAGLERAIECIQLRLENGLNTEAEAKRALPLLRTETSLEEASTLAYLVVEAITENVAAKQELFKQLDGMLDPGIPICSNTSGLRITDIATLCKHPERTVTTHFWLPAHLVPLVEVVMGDKTDLRIAQDVVVELKRWKKSPVLVKRDLPGQLANRVFQAIIRESIDIVASGLASAEDVDTAISCGMAMRFPVWGPLQHLDAVGLDLGLSVQETVLPDLCSEPHANAYLKDLVEQGKLGEKTGGGFYDWNERSMKAAMQKRDQFIIETVKIVNALEHE